MQADKVVRLRPIQGPRRSMMARRRRTGAGAGVCGGNAVGPGLYSSAAAGQVQAMLVALCVGVISTRISKPTGR